MQFKIFQNQNIIQGISERKFGSMVGKNRNKKATRFLKSSGYKIKNSDFVWAEQVFGKNVHICQRKDSGKIIKNVDGLISNIPGQILAIFSADCVPILLFDSKNKVVAALHGSRKSLTLGIIKETMGKMNLKFGTQPKDILIGIGPHIRKCHYFLKEKTYQELKDTPFKKYFLYKNQTIYFDLTRLTFDELLKLGVKRKNIEDCKICTFCNFQKYFSARKKEENQKIYKEKTIRFASFIGLEGQEILKLNSETWRDTIKKSIEALKNGKILVCPTDTVYGLIADATNKKAVKKLFKIKKRDFKKAVPIFVKDIEMAKKLAFVNKEQEKFLKKAWPGKVTAVLKLKIINSKLKIYGIAKKTIALRIPKYKFIQELLKRVNRPLTGTSANISGKPASTKIKEVISQFKKEKLQPDLIINAGNLKKNKPSTVIDLTLTPPTILRE